MFSLFLFSSFIFSLHCCLFRLHSYLLVITVPPSTSVQHLFYFIEYFDHIIDNNDNLTRNACKVVVRSMMLNFHVYFQYLHCAYVYLGTYEHSILPCGSMALCACVYMLFMAKIQYVLDEASFPAYIITFEYSQDMTAVLLTNYSWNNLLYECVRVFWSVVRFVWHTFNQCLMLVWYVTLRHPHGWNSIIDRVADTHHTLIYLINKFTIIL